MNKQLINAGIDDKIKMVNDALGRYLPGRDQTPEVLHESMRYSVNAGGKRLRPVLVLAASEAVGGELLKALPAACAIELIHTYSLIHDDLPAMDNDDYRRGKLTNHKVFGESMAILAGDALLTYAFELMTETTKFDLSPGLVLEIIKEVAVAAGSKGMIGGQAVDILSENKTIDTGLLEYIHSHKTGALFTASIRTGALIGGAGEHQLDCLTLYARHLGLAFQITDDILDVEGDSEKLGKTVGSDERKQKSTYPSLYGLDESKRLAGGAIENALSAIKDFDEGADTLRYIASSLLEREK